MKKLILILIILAVLVTAGFWISKNEEEPINLKHYCETESDCVVSDRDPAGVGTCLNKTWNEEKVIKVDDRFSAMQKATAFPISSIAALMAEGVFDGEKSQCRGYWDCFDKSLSYKDVPFDRFNENLKTLVL